MAYPYLSDATIRTWVRTVLNEPTPRIYTNTEIDAWTNMAVQEIAQFTLGYEESDYTDALETGLCYYPYPTAGIKVESVIYLGSSEDTPGTSAKGLIKMHPRQFAQMQDDTAGEPVYWTDFNELVWVWPPPSASENADFIRIFYYKYTANSANEQSNLIDYLQEWVVFYDMAKAYEKVGKIAQAQQYMSIFYNFISYLRQVRYNKPVDSEDMMRTADRTRLTGQGA